MPEFSTPDGFVDITECLAEMIKFAANEPSLGLFYVQQHAQNAVPNAVGLRNRLAGKSRETALHAEDSEDSIAAVSSMKQCGPHIADGMIGDIEKALAVISAKQPIRGGPAGRGRPAAFSRQGSEKGGYFSSVLNSAKKKASNFKWGPLDHAAESTLRRTSSGGSGSSTAQDAEGEELPLSSGISDEPRDPDRDIRERDVITGENYDVFKADKEAKLEQWLGEHGNPDGHRGET